MGECGRKEVAPLQHFYCNVVTGMVKATMGAKALRPDANFLHAPDSFIMMAAAFLLQKRN
jgi:hypothetical protein